MAVFVVCPQCGVQLNIPETFLGKKVRCGTCNTVFEAQPASPAPPRSAESPSLHVAAPLPPASAPGPAPAPESTQELVVACPQCGVKLSIPATFLGKKVRCATCSSVFEAQPEGSSGAAEADLPEAPLDDLPTAPLDDEPVRKKAKRRRGLEPDNDEFSVREDREGRRRARRILRDSYSANHRGGMIMTFGILGLAFSLMGFAGAFCVLFCIFWIAGLALSICAWVLGQSDLSQMDRGDMNPAGRGQTQVGHICGMIGTGLSIATMLCGCVVVMLSIAGNAAGTSRF